MANILVDHNRLDVTAETVERYVNHHKEKMNRANNQVQTLSTSWQGQDFAQFCTQWNRVTENGSTSQKMIMAMENYGKFLRFASGKYKEAQINAINRSNGIPRW